MVYFKMSKVGGDTNPGRLPWAVPPVQSAPPTINAEMLHFEMHPYAMIVNYYLG